MISLIATVFALINSASHQTMTTVFFQARVWCHIDDDYVDSKVKMAITAAAAKPRRYTGLRVIILGYIQELHLPQNALKLKIKFRISSWEIFQTLFKGYSICPQTCTLQRPTMTPWLLLCTEQHRAHAESIHNMRILKVVLFKEVFLGRYCLCFT